LWLLVCAITTVGQSDKVSNLIQHLIQQELQSSALRVEQRHAQIYSGGHPAEKQLGRKRHGVPGGH